MTASTTFLRNTFFLCLAMVPSARALTPRPQPQPQARGTYRLFWTATRVSDHTALLSVSMPVRPGQSSTVRTDSTRATETAPAFPSFTAQLSANRPSGVFELVTRASLREVRRTKKGKLKKSKRDIGALVPTRVGQTQIVSSSNDPIQLEVRLERE